MCRHTHSAFNTLPYNVHNVLVPTSKLPSSPHPTCLGALHCGPCQKRITKQSHHEANLNDPN